MNDRSTINTTHFEPESRSIRRVPCDWNHPTWGEMVEENAMLQFERRILGDRNDYFPMFNREYQEAAQEWLDNCVLWSHGKHPDQLDHSRNWPLPDFYWDWAGTPPEKAYYRHGRWSFRSEDATCFQYYETVSEGTPASPKFESIEELERWLIQHAGYAPTDARRFIETGFRSSFYTSSKDS